MNNKLNFKVYVDGRSEEIQKHLFALGYKWDACGTTVSHLDKPFLFVAADMCITQESGMLYFKENPVPELTVAEVLALEPAPVEPEHQFQPFGRVLVRDADDVEWSANLYSHYDISACPHICIGSAWARCIPYEGNEHLLGTANSPE